MSIRSFLAGVTMAVLLSAPVFVFAQEGSKPERGKRERGRGPWSSSGRGGKHQAGDWLRKYKSLSPQEQEKALVEDPKFKELPPERQQELRERLQRFNALPQEQQDRIVERMSKFEQMTPEQRGRWRKLQAEADKLPRERQRTLRHSFRRLRDVPVGDRDKALDSERSRHSFTDEEQRLLREMLAAGDELERQAVPAEDRSPR